MGKWLKNALSEAEYFWATQKQCFYFGMVLCMLLILNIPVCIPYLAGVLASPVLTALIFFLIWLFNYRGEFNKKTLITNIGMAFSGGLLTALFALI